MGLLGKKIDSHICFNRFLFRDKFLIFFLILFYNCCFNKSNRSVDLAPEFDNIVWLNGPEQKITNLVGKVVLIRWWTDECEYCVQTSPNLNNWNSELQDSGLVIIGMYHPKPGPRDVEINEIYKYIREKNFLFPIGIDSEWRNLQNYWLRYGPKAFTSVSFLIDKKGRIRHVHQGGEFHKDTIVGHGKCLKDYWELDSTLRVLLAE